MADCLRWWSASPQHGVLAQISLGHPSRRQGVRKVLLRGKRHPRYQPLCRGPVVCGDRFGRRCRLVYPLPKATFSLRLGESANSHNRVEIWSLSVYLTDQRRKQGRNLFSPHSHSRTEQKRQGFAGVSGCPLASHSSDFLNQSGAIESGIELPEKCGLAMIATLALSDACSALRPLMSLNVAVWGQTPKA